MTTSADCLRCQLFVALAVFGLAYPSLAAPSPGSLRLEISLAKPTSLIGEPILILGRATATGLARVPEYGVGLEVLLKRGGDYVPCPARPRVAGWGEGVTVPRDGLAFEVPVVFDERPDLSDCEPLEPGAHDLRVRVTQGGQQALSNVVRVSVTAASGEDAVLRSRLLTEPSALDYLAFTTGAGRAPAAVRALLREHPRSPYLAKARVDDLEARLLRAVEGCEPEAATPCWPSPTAITRLTAAAIPEAESAVTDVGVWKPAALSVLARLQGAAGRMTDRTATLNRLAVEFGARPAGVWAREALAAER